MTGAFVLRCSVTSHAALVVLDKLWQFASYVSDLPYASPQLIVLAQQQAGIDTSVWLALGGALFGGAGVKAVEKWMSRTETRSDWEKNTRQELTDDLERVRDERDEFRNKYWDEKEEFLNYKYPKEGRGTKDRQDNDPDMQ